MSDVRNRIRPRRGLAVSTALALAGAALVAVGGPAAQAAPVAEGSLAWGFKQSFRSYVVSFGGTNTPIAPATLDPAQASSPAPSYLFPVTGTDVTSDRRLDLRAGGGVTFSNPDHLFEVTIAEPRLKVGSGDARLIADVTFDNPKDAAPAVSTDDVVIGTAADVRVTRVTAGTAVTTKGLALTKAGADAFRGPTGEPFYLPGEPLDDLRFTVPVTKGVTYSKAESTVTLDLARTKIRKGKRAKATVRVASSALATGKVQVKRGKKVVRSFVLKKKHEGVRTVRLKKLAKGKHRLRAVYLGSDAVERGTSPKVTLRVVKKKKKR